MQPLWPQRQSEFNIDKSVVEVEKKFDCIYSILGQILHRLLAVYKLQFKSEFVQSTHTNR